MIPENTYENDSIEYNFETSVLIETLRLFSIIVKTGTNISKNENQYIEKFLHNLYPSHIDKLLYRKYLEILGEEIDLKKIAANINSYFSEETKFFLLFKIYELILAGDFTSADKKIFWEVCEHLKISLTEFFAVLQIYHDNVAESVKEFSFNKFVLLTLGNIAGNCDILLKNNSDIILLKQDEVVYVLVKYSGESVFTGGKPVPSCFIIKMVNGKDLKIGATVFHYNDILRFFRIKQRDLNKRTYFINKYPDGYFISDENSDLSRVKIEIDKMIIILTDIHNSGKLLVNNIAIYDPVMINIDDHVIYDGCTINLRSIIFRLEYDIETLRLKPGFQEIKISNGYKHQITIPDHLENHWTAVVKSEDNKLKIYPSGCPHCLYLNNQVISKPHTIENKDSVTINRIRLNFDYFNSIIKISRFSFYYYKVHNLNYSFKTGEKALDNISFEIKKGEMLAILGPSGSGKTTLLNILSGNIKPTSGSVFIGDKDFFKNYTAFRNYLGFVPQDDLLFENLTIYENLFYNMCLKFPERSGSSIESVINKVLLDVDLYDKKDNKVGSVLKKNLSGGERKRLNIALELTSECEALFLDEPTTGLSSKDSEHIIQLLRKIASSGKIVIVVIHQPGKKIYEFFDKSLFLDKGGKLAYFGEVKFSYDYFKAHKDIHYSSSNINQEIFDAEYIIETLEEPLRDIDGSSLNKRKYLPVYWQENFLKYKSEPGEILFKLEEQVYLPPTPKRSGVEKLKQLYTLFRRNFVNKLRDRSNLLLTFLGSPVLAFLVSFIFRVTPVTGNNTDVYTLFQNQYFPNFLFLTVIIVLFFSLTNSVDEIIKDRLNLLREKILNIKLSSYLLSKIMSLIIFAVVQNLLFVFIAFYILKIHGLHFGYILYLTLISITGISVGLLISGIPYITSKAALNIIPLIIIPQIIFGGILIKFDDMNKQLKFGLNYDIPVISELMISRWAYEGLASLHYSFNRFDSNNYRLQKEGDEISDELKKPFQKEDSLYLKIKYDIIQDSLLILRTNDRDNYANSVLSTTFDDEDNKFSKDSLMLTPSLGATLIKYPFYVKTKFISLINKQIKTVYFDSLVLLFIIIINFIFTTLIMKKEYR